MVSSLTRMFEMAGAVSESEYRDALSLGTHDVDEAVTRWLRGVLQHAAGEEMVSTLEVKLFLDVEAPEGRASMAGGLSSYIAINSAEVATEETTLRFEGIFDEPEMRQYYVTSAFGDQRHVNSAVRRSIQTLLYPYVAKRRFATLRGEARLDVQQPPEDL